MGWSEKGLAFRWHGRKQCGVWVPIVPLAANRVIAAKDRNPIPFFIRPCCAGVGNRFRKEHQRAGGTHNRFPKTGSYVPELTPVRDMQTYGCRYGCRW